MKTIWITGWYPNRYYAYEGDFIQRQARAAALYNDVHVIYVHSSFMVTKKEIVQVKNGRLTETICYLPAGHQSGGMKLLKRMRYLAIIQKLVTEMVQEAGLPDLFHIHIPVRIGVVGTWIKKKYGLPLVISEHWGIYAANRFDHISSRSFLERYLLSNLFRQCDKLITVSNYLGNSIREQGFAKEYEVIPNVVDTSLFHYTDADRSLSFTFLHVSNLYPVKNPQLLLEAIQLFIRRGGNARFVFAGNEDNQWKNKAWEMGLHEAVEFRGVLTYTEIAHLMQQSQVLFLHSDFETFSCVTAEALCSGMPVITADTGASPELVNNRNGIRVKPGSATALCDALMTIQMQFSQYALKEISKEATSQYSYERVGGLLNELYQQLIPAKK